MYSPYSPASMQSFMRTLLCSSRSVAHRAATGIETTRRRYAVDFKAQLAAGPDLKEFLVAGRNIPHPNRFQTATDSDALVDHPYLLDRQQWSGRKRRVYFEVYGCQMNVSDTEIVWSILQKADYVKVEDIREADVVLLVTCAIREGAETKVNKINIV